MEKHIIEEIHESFVSGQRKQAASQIDAYNDYDFWEQYKWYLEDTCGDYKTIFRYFSDMTISYNRIKG